MKIGITSENKIKIEAVKNAYLAINKKIEVFGYFTKSNVGEQPINEQVLQGARNRIIDLNSRVNCLDLIVSIENGIFRENNKWMDKAVIIIYNPLDNAENIGYSEPVIFPDKYVEKANKIGFGKMTVGQVMEEAGYVSNRKDPHFDISGISRQIYLEQAVLKLVKKTFLD